MPHCVIEYSKGIEHILSPNDLVKASFDGAVDSGLFEVEHIKARAIAYECYLVGTSSSGFIHVTARLLSGRTLQQKKDLSASILKRMAELPLANAVITVDVIDLDVEVYAKASV